MPDRWAIALAVCAVAGALHPAGPPLVVGLALALAAFLLRRPGLLCLAVLVLTSTLAGRSLAGLDGVVPRPVAAEITLLSDPTPSFGGVRADARLGGRHVELRAGGASVSALRIRLAGERVTVRGELEPVAADAPWLVARHVSGRLRVYAVESWRPGGVVSQGANQLRRTLESGAEPLSSTARSLYTGLVIGDDRSQPAALADDFLGAGLTHLLAVSGQNVAFVMAVAGPVLRRLRLWPRLGVTLAVIAMFGVMTRFEPSVLRAAAMAALATTLMTIGGPVSRLRVLALATTVLLLVDPLLVRSVGFQLSAAATAAIVLAAPRLAQALAGPAWLRDAMSVTIAAQIGVAPVLLAVFGPLPVASFPANLLAVPVAGLVMVWGLTGGLLAGLAGGRVAEVLHLPTRLLLAWVAEVARRSAALPLGELRGAHVVVLAVGLGIAVWARARPSLPLHVARSGLAVAGAAVLIATVRAQAPPPLRSELTMGVVRWHERSTDVLVLGGVGGRTTLGASTTLGVLREAGIRSIDLLVIADGSVPSGLIASIEDRHPIGAIVVAGDVEPMQARAPVLIAPRPSVVLAVGALEVHCTATSDRLVAEAVPRSSADGIAGASR